MLGFILAHWWQVGLGGLGIAGAFALLGPTFLLQFALSRVGLPIVAAAVAYWAGVYVGDTTCRDNSKIAALQAQVKRAEEDRKATEVVLAKANSDAEARGVRADELQRKVDDYEQALQKARDDAAKAGHPTADCSLDDDDVRRLRDLGAPAR